MEASRLAWLEIILKAYKSKTPILFYVTCSRMVFSMPVVQRLVDECQCPSNDSPDDMVLGMCLKRMQIPISHVPYIHQVILWHSHRGLHHPTEHFLRGLVYTDIERLPCLAVIKSNIYT